MSFSTITGNTFQHREVLKAAGARWNPADKSWRIPTAALATDNIAGLPGVVITPAGAEKPVPAMPAAPRTPIEMGGYGNPVIERDGVTYLGNSTKYESVFRRDFPIYAEFLSMAELVNFAENTDPRIILDQTRGRNSAWSRHKTEWHGTASMTDAISLVRGGWQEGIDIAREVIELLTPQPPMKKTRTYKVAGGSVNVGRMLGGTPKHMRVRTRQPANKVITLVNNISSSARIKSENNAIRGAIIAAVADTLEQNGYSCEIIDIAPVLAKRGIRNANFMVVVRTKTAGEKLNLSDNIFASGHPSMLRRLIFSVYGTPEAFRENYAGFGIPTNYRTDEPNTYVFNKINSNPIGGMKDKIKQIMAEVLPDDLPITLNL